MLAFFLFGARIGFHGTSVFPIPKRSWFNGDSGAIPVSFPFLPSMIKRFEEMLAFFLCGARIGFHGTSGVSNTQKELVQRRLGGVSCVVSFTAIDD